MLDLNKLRRTMGEHMVSHPRGSMDSALFTVLKLAYSQGVEDGKQLGVREADSSRIKKSP